MTANSKEDTMTNHEFAKIIPAKFAIVARVGALAFLASAAACSAADPEGAVDPALRPAVRSRSAP
jgi:hypothetical protein